MRFPFKKKKDTTKDQAQEQARDTQPASEKAEKKPQQKDKEKETKATASKAARTTEVKATKKPVPKKAAETQKRTKRTDPARSQLEREPVAITLARPVEPDPPDFHVDHFTLTLSQVAKLLGAAKAHEQGVTGRGTHVVIVDSGFYPHPYFAKNHPDADVTVIQVPAPRWPGDTAPLMPAGRADQDLNGHGTAMVANVLAIAPEAKITMLVCRSDIHALVAALDLQPDVISFSRGPTFGAGKSANNDPVGRSDLLDTYQSILVEKKTGLAHEPIVVDAVGNAGARGLLSLLPKVISVGGTYMDENGDLTASSYTNAYAIPEDVYQSKAERGIDDDDTSFVTKTQVPDITSLCGSEAHPDYLALPTQPGSELEGKTTPGWGLASGSSCATPQVAAACALLKQLHPELTPAQALTLLRNTAWVVEHGHGFSDGQADGLPADGNWSRLIDVGAAVTAALTRNESDDEGQSTSEAS